MGAFFVSILKYKIYTDNIFIDFFKLFILNIMYGSLMELLMDRYTIIQTIGKDYLVSNIENNEFSYQKAFKQLNQDFMSKKITNKTGGGFCNLDLRFIDDKNKFSILIETKQNYDDNLPEAIEQLSAYVSYEKQISNYTILSILANTNDNRIIVWQGEPIDNNLLPNETSLKNFEYYINLLKPVKRNNREQVMRNTYQLNEELHAVGIPEKLRGQFVGTCLLAIKNNLIYNNLTTKQIIAGIKEILETLLGKSLNRAEKLAIIDKKILDAQSIKELKDYEFQIILNFINEKIYPFINDKSTQGQDLLNLFFTTFNKYVGKADKNQAFTPDHIVSFMCKIIGINKHSRVLDPCCGSGSFLVRALTDALDNCENEEEQNHVKEEQIYGIEAEDTAFGLATTNMLIHGDGNSNIYQANCFDKLKDIENWNIDKVLMNPPYNAQKNRCFNEYVKTWKNGKKEDPSKGFHFVYEVAKHVKKGQLAVLLPMQCAIGTDKEIRKYKQLMLQEHHLKAVFSLPPDMFHPGASVNACCMIFELGVKHDKASIKETFFGYYKDDGFVKRKNLGRVEKTEGVWKEIQNKWLNMYFKHLEVAGLSAVKEVTYEDEWLAEAYMETDYSLLTDKNFEQTIRDFLAYQIKHGKSYE